MAEIFGYALMAALGLAAIAVGLLVLKAIAEITSYVSIAWADIIDEHFPVWAAILMFVLAPPTFIAYLTGLWFRASLYRKLSEDITPALRRPSLFSTEYWRGFHWNPLPFLVKFYIQPNVRSGTLIWLMIFAGYLAMFSLADASHHMRAAGLNLDLLFEGYMAVWLMPTAALIWEYFYGNPIPPERTTFRDASAVCLLGLIVAFCTVRY